MEHFDQIPDSSETKRKSSGLAAYFQPKQLNIHSNEQLFVRIYLSIGFQWANETTKPLQIARPLRSSYNHLDDGSQNLREIPISVARSNRIFNKISARLEPLEVLVRLPVLDPVPVTSKIYRGKSSKYGRGKTMGCQHFKKIMKMKVDEWSFYRSCVGIFIKISNSWK